MTKKILVIDLDNNLDRVKNFSNDINHLFKRQVIHLPLLAIDKSVNTNYSYEHFSIASFTLENFILNCGSYWSSDKEFINVFYLWGEYNLHTLSNIEMFLDYSPKNLILFSSVWESYNDKWIFGNIIGMLKWSASLFKIDNGFKQLVDENTNYKNGNDFKYLLWYANRIGLDVKLINDFKNPAIELK